MSENSVQIKGVSLVLGIIVDIAFCRNANANKIDIIKVTRSPTEESSVKRF